MSTKVIKITKLLGQANESGLSFAAGAFMYAAREGFMESQGRAKRIGGVTTGPARVFIIVEQDVIVND
jgi:hypothetical protein